MSEMVERVARALCVNAGHDPDAPFVNRHGATLAHAWRYEYFDAASAAIAAMKPEFERCYALGLEHGSADATMIQAALKEPT